MSPSLLARACTPLAALALTAVGLAAPVAAPAPAEAGTSPIVEAGTTASTTGGAVRTAPDPRRTRGLFVDPLMSAYQQGGVYRSRIGSRATAFWVIPEAYPTAEVSTRVRDYTSRALAAGKTPVLSVYGIPGRDCGQYSSGNPLTTPAAYRAWIAQVAAGLRRQQALVVLEPDALPLFSSAVDACPTKPAGWQGMLRYASKRLAAAGAWVYLDAGHSNWTPYDARPAALVRSGIRWARGFSTNVSNFRATAAEKAYAATLLRGLRKRGITGKHYVVDTSRNGARPAADGYDVINPLWARLGRPPRLSFRGAFDGTLWVKHPGESDGTENGGPPSGQWCDLLADRLLGLPESSGC